MKTSKFIRTYNEWLTIPIAFVLFLVMPSLLRLIDPTAGAFDLGVFHADFKAIASLFLYCGVSWVVIKLNFPSLKKFLDDDAEGYLASGDPKHQKGVILAFAVYFGIILLLHLLSN